LRPSTVSAARRPRRTSGLVGIAVHSAGYVRMAFKGTRRPRARCSWLDCLHGGVRVLVGPPVFKTGVSSDPAQAGSIPVRLR
jgi:hypothetical protein